LRANNRIMAGTQGKSIEEVYEALYFNKEERDRIKKQSNEERQKEIENIKRIIDNQLRR
jgi:hypothetical protein